MADVAGAEIHDVAGHAAAPARRVPVEISRIVQDSYRLVEPASDLVATLFFRRLGDIAPELKGMLDGDEDEQRRQLLIALGLAVASLERFNDIVPSLELLGVKYRARGVTEFHYGAVGEALLWTLKHSMGPHWSAEVEDGWTALCTLIAEIMTAPE